MQRGHIFNYEEFLSVIKKYNFEVFNPGLNSLKEDISYLNGMNLLISPHGAGLANMIFSHRNDLEVIEISYGEKWEKDIYYYLAKEFGYGFQSLKAKEYSEKSDQCCIVDLEILEELISKAVNLQSK